MVSVHPPEAIEDIAGLSLIAKRSGDIFVLPKLRFCRMEVN